MCSLRFGTEFRLDKPRPRVGSSDMSNLKQYGLSFLFFWLFVVLNCKGNDGDGAPSVPETPQNFMAIPSDGQVTLSWTQLPGVTYDLFFSTNAGFGLANGTEISAVTPPYVHEGLTNDTVYYYLLTANNSSGTSAPTAEVSATPGAPATPQNFDAMPSDGQVTLTWIQIPGVTYNLFYSTSAEFGLENGTEISPVTPPYVHEGLTNDISYYYLLTAHNSAGASAPTGKVSATPLPNAPPEAPQNLTAVSSNQQITLTWTQLPGVAYDLFHSTSAGIDVDSETVMKISNITPPYPHKGLMDNTTYYYRLTVKNRLGMSAPTAEVSAITLPAAPQGLEAVAFRGRVTLTWTIQEVGITYDLFYATTGGDFEPESGMKIPGVTPPYLHKGLMSGTTHYYRLTANNFAGASVPTDEVSATPQAQISAGSTHTCIRVDDGAMCWGNGLNGRLGYSETNGDNDKMTPTPVDGLTSGVTQISAGFRHTCAVVDGRALCWGSGGFGKLGNGSNSDAFTPRQVDGLTTGVTQISAGSAHACAIVDGGAMCWGEGSFGELGDGRNSDSNTPVQVDGLTTGVTQIEVGGAHTCAVVESRALCWGWGDNGRLGHNETANVNANKSRPTQVYGLTTRVTQIEVAEGSSGHTCAVVEGGAMCWGVGSNGKLGHNRANPNENRPTPTQVHGLTSGVTQVAVGDNHSCAVVEGRAVCWGNGGNGRLGHNESTRDASKVIPTQVYGLTSGVIQITAGDAHTCAVANGRTQCWGIASNGRLGHGISSGEDGAGTRFAPTDVSGL